MYQKMYTVLFNAITDSLEQMGELNFGAAQHILRRPRKRRKSCTWRPSRNKRAS